MRRLLAPRPSSLTRPRRQRDLERLDGGPAVDLLVVGGGVVGCGVALDAATRGLSVALVERDDLASGTSRWSSKLVHGGLRYLAQLELGIARRSAVERGILMERTAPHLVRAAPFLTPVGGALPPGRAALVAAGYLAGDALRLAAGTSARTLPPPRWLAPAAARRLAPGLAAEELAGAFLNHDGQLSDDVRLVVALARTAAAYGARVVTRCEATELGSDGASVRDREDDRAFEVRARRVVNATGVWADRLDPRVTLRPSRGAHLVLDARSLGGLAAGITVAVPGSRNRFVFLLPQRDGRAYLGLTDDPVDAATGHPAATEDDVTFLLATVNRVLRRRLTRDDVLGSFAGLRPLVAASAAFGDRDGDGDGDGWASADRSRDHRIIAAPDGPVTVVGGKLTTYRSMAEEVVDTVARDLGAGPCVTSRTPLVGALPRRRVAAAPDDWLVRRYGTEARDVAALAALSPELGARAVGRLPYLVAELVWGGAHEGATTVGDLLDRRTRIGLVDADRRSAEWAAEQALGLARTGADGHAPVG